MALQWADNFSQYGVGSTAPQQRMTDGLYATAEACHVVTDPDPTASGNVAYFNDPSVSFKELRKVLSSTQNTVGAAARFWLPSLPSSSETCLFRFQDANNTNQVALLVSSTGSLVVRRGEGWSGSAPPVNNVKIADTVGPVLVAGAWNHVEMKTFINATTGTVEVKVNAIQVLNIGSLNTLNGIAGVAQISIQNRSPLSTSGALFYMKDFCLWDTTGTRNNDFLSTVSVVTLLPNSDVDFNWTPSTGTTGFNLIDNVPTNDSEYISAGDPPPDASVFGMTNLPEDVTSVKGIVTVVRARKSDGGDAQLQVGLVSNGDVDLGADRPITTAFTYWYDISEEDPDTAAPWTPAAVDDADIQVNRTL